jgi:transposase
MKRLPKGTYTKELREQAVGPVTQEGLSVPEAARRLSLLKGTLANWVKAAKAGQPVCAVEPRASAQYGAVSLTSIELIRGHV